MNFALATPRRLGQFDYCSHRHERTVFGTLYIVVISNAYNAFGLIGSEINGVAVVNDTKKCVVAAEVARQATGSFGPSPAQVDIFQGLTEATDAEFLDLLTKLPQFRGLETLGSGE